MKHYDLFVIGAGSGGVAASRRAASFGAKVGICEGDRVGGTCVIRGCVPKKLLVYASHFAEDFVDAVGFGWSVSDMKFDWSKLIANKNKEIDRLNEIYKKMLANSGVELIEASGSFIDQNTIQVGAEKIRADKILIATGAHPVMPQIPGIEHAISSNEAFHLKALPERVAILGGGYIAVEFAGIFNGLGSETTLLYRSEQILRGFDDDICKHLSGEIIKKGVNLRTNTNVVSITRKGKALELALNDGSKLEVDVLMCATGRKPNLAPLNLEAAAVKLNEKGAIQVNEFSRTNVENIFAVGDVTDRINLTPVAINEGRAFADTEYGNNPRHMDYNDVASTVFSQPSVGSCGMTEEQARAEYSELDIYRSEFRALKNTMSGNEERTLMKLVVDAQSQRVLGAHMVGPDAAEIIQGIAIAIKCSATKQQFDATVAIHPSAAEEFVTMREKYLK